jgi:hypothetical protein
MGGPIGHDDVLHRGHAQTLERQRRASGSPGTSKPTLTREVKHRPTSNPTCLGTSRTINVARWPVAPSSTRATILHE